MAQFGNTSPLGVVRTQSPFLDPRHQHPVLFAQERDDVRLLSLKPINRIGQELKRKPVCSLSRQRSIQLWDNTGRRMGHFEGRNTVSCTRSRVPSQSGRRLSSTGSRRATTEDSAHPGTMLDQNDRSESCPLSHHRALIAVEPLERLADQLGPRQG